MSKSSLTVELLHPPHPESIEDRLDAPLGLLYIAANLRKHGHEVRINDLSGIPQSEWEIGMADIYGTTMYAPTMAISEQIARMCKEINPASKIVAGGAHPTAIPGEISSAFDIIGVGEGEEIMVDIARDYPDNKRVYRKPLEEDLDIYPNPAYDLIDPLSYKRTLGGELALTTLTSRGCPYQCSFCGLADHHKTIKRRSPENVAEEIEFLKERYSITKFIFQDDTFTINKKRLGSMLDLIRPLGIGFKAHGRSGNDTAGDYLRLRDAGCETIAWGIESGSQKMLDLMNKQTTVRKNEEVIQWAKDAGLISRAFFVLGFPGEDPQTIEETQRFIERTDPDQYFVSNFVPYPGTDVWNNPEKYGITRIHTDFEKYYQINGNGFGSRNIETENLSGDEFGEMEREFRSWINQRRQRGKLQEYEGKLPGRKRLSEEVEEI
ncbi:MAG: radical SAM protein [Nanoarchaeota archaeon]|nr:radical SAM protein [Nanoarchaeota archaeon]